MNINFISNKEISSFKDGAQIQSIFIFDDLDPDNSGFKHSDNLTTAIDMYKQSSIYRNIINIKEIISENFDNYNPEAINSIIENTASMDIKMYKNIIMFILALINQKEINCRKEYIDKILNIISTETLDTSGCCKDEIDTSLSTETSNINDYCEDEIDTSLPSGETDH